MRILIVGASSSIGLKVTRQLVERGDDVIATFSRSRPAEDGARWLPLDLQDSPSFEEFALQLDGAIDHVILIAGILPGKALRDYSPDLLTSVMTVNFMGPALLLQRLLPLMSATGSVLAFSSISAQQGSFDPIYAASKAALTLFIKSLAVWSRNGIRFNCVAPGLVEDSTMCKAMAPERQQVHRDQTPTGMLLDPDDLARTVVELTDKKWQQLNGAVISLNGGRLV